MRGMQGAPLAVTMGEPAGIGGEITAGALPWALRLALAEMSASTKNLRRACAMQPTSVMAVPKLAL